jgi:branched-chain amino acid transport system permease protein
MNSKIQKINIAVVVAFVAFLFAAPIILPMIANPFWVSVTSEILIWSLFAASVNLLFGYIGLLSFGQALYFGFGMYGVAIGIAHLGLGFWPAFALGIIASVAMSVIAGSLAVRLTWHYFAIITVVFSLIFYFLALSWKPLTGGDDGIGFSMPPMLRIGDFEVTLLNPNTQYYFILLVVIGCFYLMHRLLQSPLGKAMIAVRENDVRASLIGLDVYRLRLVAFIAAGFMAGVAGALFAFFGRYASASYMFYHVSGEGVVWTLVGGVGTLLGPVFGTALLVILREELSVLWDNYLLLVGAIVILTVIYAPKGIVGLYTDMLNKLLNTSDENGDEQGGK